MGYHAHSVLLKRQMPIGIEDVWLILIDQIRHAIEVMPLPGLWNAIVVPIELVNKASAVGIMVQIGVGGIDTVVRNSCQRSGLVRSVAHSEPLVTDPKVLTDAETQALLQGSIPP